MKIETPHLKASRLTLIRGLPGSGKSTFAKSMNGVHAEADQYFYTGGSYVFDPSKLAVAHSQCLTKAVDALKSDESVVVANTFTTFKEMAPYLEAARQYGANVVVLNMKTQYEGVHNVPQAAVDRMKARWYDFPVSDQPSSVFVYNIYSDSVEQLGYYHE